MCLGTSWYFRTRSRGDPGCDSDRIWNNLDLLSFCRRLAVLGSSHLRRDWLHSQKRALGHRCGAGHAQLGAQKRHRFYDGENRRGDSGLRRGPLLAEAESEE